MEVPEDTGSRFRLAMIQPIQVYSDGIREEYALMSGPLNKIVTFEWTGKIFSQKDHDWDGAIEYQLISLD